MKQNLNYASMTLKSNHHFLPTLWLRALRWIIIVRRLAASLSLYGIQLREAIDVIEAMSRSHAHEEIKAQ